MPNLLMILSLLCFWGGSGLGYILKQALRCLTVVSDLNANFLKSESKRFSLGLL